MDAGLVHIGSIKICGDCGVNSYVRANNPCPKCGAHFGSTPESELTVIVPLGAAEISRRTVEGLWRGGHIDDFTKGRYK